MQLVSMLITLILSIAAMTFALPPPEHDADGKPGVDVSPIAQSYAVTYTDPFGRAVSPRLLTLVMPPMPPKSPST